MLHSKSYYLFILSFMIGFMVSCTSGDGKSSNSSKDTNAVNADASEESLASEDRDVELLVSSLSIQGVLAKGEALKDAPLFIQFPNSAPQSLNVQSDALGNYSVELESVSVPFLLYTTHEGVTLGTLIVDASETNQVQHLNPVTSFVIRSVLGEFPLDADHDASVWDVATWETQVSATVSKLFGNSIPASAFFSDPTFVARSSENTDNVPSLADTLLDALDLYLTAHDLTLATAESLLSEGPFLSVLTAELAQLQVAPDDLYAILPEAQRSFAESLVSEWELLSDLIASEQIIESESISIAFQSMQSVMNEYARWSDKTSYLHDEWLTLLQNTGTLLRNRIVTRIKHQKTLLESELELLTVIENGAKQVGYLLSFFAIDADLVSQTPFIDAARGIFTYATDQVFDVFLKNNNIQEGLTQAEASIQANTFETLSVLSQDATLVSFATARLAKVVSDQSETGPSVEISTSSSNDEVACTLPNSYELAHEGDSVSDTMVVALKAPLPPVPGQPTPLPVDLVLENTLLEWTSDNEDTVGYTILHCGRSTAFRWETLEHSTAQDSVVVPHVNDVYVVLPYQERNPIASILPYSGSCYDHNGLQRCYGPASSVHL